MNWPRLNRCKTKSIIGGEHLKFSFRGFSAKRTAYLLIGVQLWLICLVDTEAHYDAAGGIAALSLTVVLANLLLGLFCPRSDKDRFLPFALAFFMLVMTVLFIPTGWDGVRAVDDHGYRQNMKSSEE